MKNLTKHNTDGIEMGVIYEDGIAVIYALWTKRGEVTSKSLAWIPSEKLWGWLDTSAADLYLNNKVTQLLASIKVMEEVKEVVIIKKEINPSLGRKTRTFIHTVTGEIVATSNVALFGRERGIPYTSLKKVICGARTKTHGWIIAPDLDL